MEETVEDRVAMTGSPRTFPHSPTPCVRQKDAAALVALRDQREGARLSALSSRRQIIHFGRSAPERLQVWDTESLR